MSTKNAKGPLFDPGLCRCCGSMKKCRVLTVEYESFGQKEIYSDMMMDCFGLLLSHLDGKETERLICATCVLRIREAFAFRKQVLRCEEIFLQMKMLDSDSRETHNQIEDALVDGAPKVEIELVKSEPEDRSSEGDSVCGDALADVADDDVKPDMDYVDEDDMPLHRIKPSPVITRQKVSRSSLPLTRQKVVKNRPTGMDRQKKKLERNIIDKKVMKVITAKKPQMPMSEIQQLIRERDPTYISETNILTIVEFSYVCPFKCRHNHLLCYYCGQNFSDPIKLREHTEEIHNPRKFKVTEHKNMIKLDLTRIDCRLCGMKINKLDDFKRHISTVHGKKYYFDFKDLVLPFKLSKDEPKCAICEVIFPYFHALNKHMNEHFSNYVCETCGLGFVDKGRFVMHQQRHEEGDFPCETCGKIFKAQYNRELHIDRVHMKKGRVYCPKCDIKLMSYPQKLKHLVEVHGEEPLSFPCNMCDRIFETRRTLTIHRRKDHLKDYRYECQCCGQKFFTRFALNNHMPTHTGERNFKCKVCEKSYPRLKTLKDHMRIHTNDRRYRCHICGQAFIQNCSLKGHMKSQHPEYG